MKNPTTQPRAHWILILMAWLPALAGCRETIAPAPPPTMTVETTGPIREGERLAVSGSQDLAVVDVHSDFGIGGAVLKPGAAGWPGRLVFRLHLGGLEQFAVSNPRTGAAAVSSVESRPPFTIRCELRKPGDTGPPQAVDPDSCPLKTRIATPDGAAAGIPLKQGFFEVALAPADLATDNAPLEIRWIDFHR